jgi:hypothetical protein
LLPRFLSRGYFCWDEFIYFSHFRPVAMANVIVWESMFGEKAQSMAGQVGAFIIIAADVEIFMHALGKSSCTLTQMVQNNRIKYLSVIANGLML